MTTTEKANRLHSHLANMIALEKAIDQRLGDLLPEVTSHTEVSALLTKFQSMAAEQRQTLEARLQDIGGNVAISNEVSSTEFASEIGQNENYPVSSALQTAYTLFNQAIVGYAVLHPLATRFADSLVIADEGTSYHLCRTHARNYIEAVQEISQLIHDVILWELEQEHLECQCTCPSCGIGVCVCGLAGRSFLRDAWIEAGPIAADRGVFVRTPRDNSAASKIGLHHGDVILAAEGEEIGIYGDLQDIVRNTEPGGNIQLTVRRFNADNEDVVMVRPK
ncbi:MAG: PDZ domain-containing protein [Gammaproteobacteria bacterium]|nr:PDZ domain-containing protein [Gammaproteobacteria bacterium]